MDSIFKSHPNIAFTASTTIEEDPGNPYKEKVDFPKFSSSPRKNIGKTLESDISHNYNDKSKKIHSSIGTVRTVSNSINPRQATQNSFLNISLDPSIISSKIAQKIRKLPKKLSERKINHDNTKIDSSTLPHAFADKIHKVFAKHWVFKSLPTETLHGLSLRCRIMRLKHGDFIKNSSKHDILYIILAGEINVIHRNKVVAVMKKDSFFEAIAPFHQLSNQVKYRASQSGFLLNPLSSHEKENFAQEYDDVTVGNNIDNLLAEKHRNAVLLAVLDKAAMMPPETLYKATFIFAEESVKERLKIYELILEISSFASAVGIRSKKKRISFSSTKDSDETINVDGVKYDNIASSLKKIELHEDQNIFDLQIERFTYFIAFGTVELLTKNRTNYLGSNFDDMISGISLGFFYPNGLIFELDFTIRYYVSTGQECYIKASGGSVVLFKLERTAFLQKLGFSSLFPDFEEVYNRVKREYSEKIPISQRKKDAKIFNFLSNYLSNRRNQFFSQINSNQKLKDLNDFDGRSAGLRYSPRDLKNQFDVFSNLSHQMINYLFICSKLSRYEAGVEIYMGSLVSKTLFMVVRGGAIVRYHTTDKLEPDSERILSDGGFVEMQLGEGDFIGEVSYIFSNFDLYPKISFKPTQASLVLEIPIEVADEICTAYPETEEILLKSAQKKYRSILPGLKMDKSVETSLIVQRIGRWPFFRGISESSLENIAELSKLERYPKKSLVLEASEEVNYLCLLTAGRIKATDDRSGVIHKILKAGDVYGLASSNSEHTKNMNLSYYATDGECEIVLIFKQALVLIQNERPDIIDRLRILADRVDTLPTNIGYSDDLQVLKVDSEEEKQHPLISSKNVILDRKFLEITFRYIGNLQEKLNCRLVCKDWCKYIGKNLAFDTINFNSNNYNVKKFNFLINLSKNSLRIADFDRAPINITHIRMMANNCSKLVYLNLLNCKSGILDPEILPLIFTRMHCLEWLALPRKLHFRRPWPESRISNLTTIIMDEMELRQPDISALSKNNPELKDVHITRCKYVDDMSVKNLVANLRYLKSLSLSGCMSITDISLKYVASMCPNLVSLDISTCPLITDAGMYELSLGSIEFEYLNISNNTFLTEASILCFKEGIRNLRVLKMRYCPLMSEVIIHNLKEMCPWLTLFVMTGCTRIHTDRATFTLSPNATIVSNEPNLQKSQKNIAEYIPLEERYNAPKGKAAEQANTKIMIVEDDDSII